VPRLNSRCPLRRIGPGQNAGQVNGARGRVAFAQDSFDVQQATGIDRSDELGPGRGHTLGLRISHGGGHVGKLGGESSAETTAFLGASHFNQLESLDAAQKLERFVAQVKLAQADRKRGR
jgi:hypothetical protein